jgi:hypothetical protein
VLLYSKRTQILCATAACCWWNNKVSPNTKGWMQLLAATQPSQLIGPFKGWRDDVSPTLTICKVTHADSPRRQRGQVDSCRIYGHHWSAGVVIQIPPPCPCSRHFPLLGNSHVKPNSAPRAPERSKAKNTHC